MLPSPDRPGTVTEQHLRELRHAQPRWVLIAWLMLSAAGTLTMVALCRTGAVMAADLLVILTATAIGAVMIIWLGIRTDHRVAVVIQHAQANNQAMAQRLDTLAEDVRAIQLGQGELRNLAAYAVGFADAKGGREPDPARLRLVGN